MAAADVGERELAEMVLVRPDEARADAGIGGMRSLLRALAGSGLPVVFGPGVIHLPSVPRAPQVQPDRHRDRRQGVRGGVRDRRPVRPPRRSRWHETAMVLLELGGAFTAALAIAGGQIVDGIGGSSGPLGVRAAGALDGELAYLLGPALSKRHAVQRRAPWTRPATLDLTDLAALWASPAQAEGWAALLEAAAKAVRALIVSVPAPHEIVVSGRLARAARADRDARRRRSTTSPRWSRSSRAGRAPPRAAARCWPMGWRAVGTPPWSRCWDCASPAAPRSIICVWRAPTRSCSADATARDTVT